ncbi:MAG: CHAD domain-containing protein [Gammaproteobacteria bacterium]|nr:CHAD domain-containing protein [Gammaproteobacteria bacterium]
MPKLVKLLTDVLEQLQKQITTHQHEWTLQQNPEALHSLRICLRQLRSLLRPLRSELNEVIVLDQLAKEIITKTNCIRDIEVLILELKQRQKPEIAMIYEQKLQSSFLNIVQHLEFQSIIQSLSHLSLSWQKSISLNTAEKLEHHIAEDWQKQSHKLFKLIQQNVPDKHQIRILIKHLRYHSEIYQKFLPKRAPQQTQQLKKLQDLLGTWHDYFVWLNDIDQCQELVALEPIWREQLQYWEEKSDQALKKLKLKHFV